MTFIPLTWVAVFFGQVMLAPVPLVFDSKPQCERELLSYQKNGWLVGRVECRRGR